MSDISQNLDLIKIQIPASVKLVAVSKTRPVEDILVAYNCGYKCFGENRVQELLSKKDDLPEDIEWHIIGHLQSNKVKLIAPFISMIESVDSFKLLSVINNEAHKVGRIINCLLQIHIATEDTKFGFSIEEILSMVHSEEFLSLNSVRICGLMGMSTFTDNEDQIRKEFRFLKECFFNLKNNSFSGKPEFCEISMGMSGDFKIAIQEGSTIIRIGSLIFGDRKQTKSI
jgi:pyridoxal phosphate enzyme (YggS family)